MLTQDNMSSMDTMATLFPRGSEVTVANAELLAAAIRLVARASPSQLEVGKFPGGSPGRQLPGPAFSSEVLRVSSILLSESERVHSARDCSSIEDPGRV